MTDRSEKLGTCDCWAGHHGKELHEKDAYLSPQSKRGVCVNWREQPAPAEPPSGAEALRRCIPVDSLEAMRNYVERIRIESQAAAVEGMSAEPRVQSTIGGTTGVTSMSAEQSQQFANGGDAAEWEQNKAALNKRPTPPLSNEPLAFLHSDESRWARQIANGCLFWLEFAEAYAALKVRDLVDLNNKLARLNIEQRQRAERAESALASARRVLTMIAPDLDCLSNDGKMHPEHDLHVSACARCRVERLLKSKPGEPVEEERG